MGETGAATEDTPIARTFEPWPAELAIFLPHFLSPRMTAGGENLRQRQSAWLCLSLSICEMVTVSLDSVQRLWTLSIKQTQSLFTLANMNNLGFGTR